MKQVYLLTGRPGTGKTSLIKQVAAQMKGKAGVFYTDEIRTQGAKEGFKLVTLEGEEAILAHVSIHSPYRVSRYGIYCWLGAGRRPCPLQGSSGV